MEQVSEVYGEYIDTTDPGVSLPDNIADRAPGAGAGAGGGEPQVGGDFARYQDPGSGKETLI
ncbi:MAG: hypothetical protein NW237_16885 [Cyanobacteriota bacterium]|nr:hypothetical protein [Cyanobacteriota bacterium]